MSTREVEVADTLPPEDTIAPQAPASGGPPVASWDRYELLDLLGKGGMGSVYKARDRRLDRTVAIKFILGADPNLTMRFLREARAQSHIDHPNVCRVYEVGEVEGRAYIALQFVDGVPLHEAATRMSLDEKIAVVRDIAVAVHEAHRLGIVHRDLKPGNVLVERTDDGRWFPIVMDFGLAREATVEAGITESGIPLGTPAYMSPEQARGDVHVIDRRSDVYSLGATIYELLTGTVPFPATSLAMALAKVIHDDPPAPRGLVPSLPVDLETIALKCLAKDPTQRYPSARALADDLGRYLDGEPILGRRLPLWQRMRLRARRHRALVILGAWSLAIIVAVAAFGIHTWLVSRREGELAAKRTRLAEGLSREATEAEGHLREAYLWPLHDTRLDRKRMRERMAAIAATEHDLGEFGNAIVHGALGRGHLALHEWQAAYDELTQAITAAAAAARPVPELHAARGRVLGELYRRALEQVRLQGETPTAKAWLAQREQALTQQYLKPALEELKQGSVAGEEVALLDARIALYRRDFALAETRAQAIANEAPGSSEARRLAADAAYGAAIDAFDRGEYEAAHTGLKRATEMYAQASDIARSDASEYEAAAQAWLQRAEIDTRQGRSPRESLQRALDILDEGALRADPADVSAYTTKSYVLLRWYRTPSLSEPDNRLPLLDGMERAAKRATEIEPGDARAWTALGIAHVYRGRYDANHGGQGIPSLDRAIDEIRHALAIQLDDLRANNALGLAYEWRGDVLDKSGREARPDYEAALKIYQHANVIEPRYLPACINQAELQTAIAEREAALGNDPEADAEAAQQVGKHCLTIDHSYHVVFDSLARAQLARADYRTENGKDPTEELAAARHDIAESGKLLPGSLDVWFQALVADRIEATSQQGHDIDPTSSIAAGRNAVGQVLRLDPRSALAYVESARLDLLEARWKMHAGSGAAEPLATALANIRKAMDLDPQLADAEVIAAEVCLQIATLQRSLVIIDAGIGYAKQALQLNPRLSRARNVYDALVRLRGR